MPTPTARLCAFVNSTPNDAIAYQHIGSKVARALHPTLVALLLGTRSTLLMYPITWHDNPCQTGSTSRPQIRQECHSWIVLRA